MITLLLVLIFLVELASFIRSFSKEEKETAIRELRNKTHFFRKSAAVIGEKEFNTFRMKQKIKEKNTNGEEVTIEDLL